MLKRENKQGDFFDSYVYDKLLPEKHVLLDIKKSIDFSFVDEQCKDLYSNSMGRPSFAPVVLFKILFLEFFCNLSDYEAVDQVQTNILYRYFVGLAISSPTPNHATLSVFRNRLSEKGFKKLFNRVVLQAQEKGLIEGKLKILDATHISASVTVQSAVNLLRHGRKTVIQKIEKTNARLAANMKLKYLNETKMYDTPSNQQVNEEIQLTKYFIKKVKKKSYDESTKDVIDLLETAVDQQSRKAKDKKYKQADEIVSLVDGDARRGAKSKTKKFMGYKAHASMDDKSNIVTSVRTISGNRNEGNKEETKKLLDEDESKEIKHEAVTADGLYDSYENRKNIRSNNMRAFISSRNRNRKKNLDNFIYDKENDTLICPLGHRPISKSRQLSRDQFIFSAKICKKCVKKENCPKLNNGRVRVTVSDTYRLSILDNGQEQKEALIKRKEIERKFGEVKVWHKLHKARYRKRSRVAIQVLMTFLVVNVKRMTKLINLNPQYISCSTGCG